MWRTNNYFNDAQQRKGKLVLFCSKKKLSALLRRITSKHDGDFYCLNCFHSFQTENQHKSHEKVCKNKDVCGIAMPSEKGNLINTWIQIKSIHYLCWFYADLY